MWSPAAQGTVPPAQHTCGVGGVGAVPFWGLPGISVQNIPLPGDLDSAGACIFFRVPRNQNMFSQKINPKAPMMFLLFLRGLSPANDSGAKKKKKKPKRKKEKGGGDQADQAQDQPVKVSSPFPQSRPSQTPPLLLLPRKEFPALVLGTCLLKKLQISSDFCMCGNCCWCRRCLQSPPGTVQSLAGCLSQSQGQTGTCRFLLPHTGRSCHCQVSPACSSTEVTSGGVDSFLDDPKSSSWGEQGLFYPSGLCLILSSSQGFRNGTHRV